MKTKVLIIGGGITGAGVARDLALRGIESILVDKKDINAGASGANHGLLHSGARYVKSDPATALQCRKKGELLKRLAPHCIEETGGFFAAVEGDDENFIADFPQLCEKSGIPTEPIDIKTARNLEPALSDKLIATYAVSDVTIDPFKLSLDNLSQAQTLGARLMCFTRVASFYTQHGKIERTALINTETGDDLRIEADMVVNASGAWAGEVAALAGIKIDILCSKGSMVVTQNRLTQRVINRLRKAADGDILVPGGTVSILGTTSVRVESPDRVYPEIDEIDRIIEQGAQMIPELETTPYVRAFCGVRPLILANDTENDRNVSRGFALIDHAPQGIENFITITGGKLTTYRIMAEKTADLICDRLGVSMPCRTQIEPLPRSEETRWTTPGSAPRHWIKSKIPGEQLMCECEMVPQSVVDSVISSIRRQNGRPGLSTIGLRSRIGRGPCQGTFCSLIISALLYDKKEYVDNQGLVHLRDFLSERWRGLKPVQWDFSLVKSELREALHCGFLGLESDPSHSVGIDP